MNRTLKRVLGLAGSAVLGLAGAVTFASAAQAHHPEITGNAVCIDGSWNVTWDVALVGPVDGKITDINPTEPAIDGTLQEGATGKNFTGTQIYPGTATEASINVSAVWYEGERNEISDSRDGHVVFQGTCAETPEEPTPEVSANAMSDCFGLYVVVGNNTEALAEITITPSAGEAVTVTPEVGEPYEQYFPVEDTEAGLTVTVTTEEGEVGVFTWNTEELNCDWGFVYDTCDGLEFELTIPENGEETTFTFTTSNGGEPIVVVVAPGTTETVVIPAVDNAEFSVHYVISTQKDEYEGEIPWVPCDEETPSESPSPKPELPKTGSSLSIMIGSAAALIVAAGVIFFLMRRRRAAQDW
ncbi:LPXTG cell wall anchor domain-containing protein [Glycomyces sp. MUSA5-2]|uniref:LPXTG cell wall anchor domain-containing protein n=1 Tax=Glycomyces sp. MUSA5-2 TaxID=2053002 RepID=UPI0030086923